MLIADTGFWVAILVKSDRHHARATAIMRDSDEGVMTTWPCISEAMYLLNLRGGLEPAIKLLEAYRLGTFEVFDLKAAHASRLLMLMKKYADLPMDFADATVVLTAEEFNCGRVLSSDIRDFAVYRYHNTKRFTNLLAP